jgi:BolA family transcriptional regulator, general stress-responsive regulator
MTATPERIEAALRAALAVDRLEIGDESALHAGHAGAGGGGHFRLQIVSPTFAGKTRIARHRLVYDALAPLMQHEIHALVIVAQSPDEV